MFYKNCSTYKDKIHWKCCFKPVLAKVIWLLAGLSLIGAWKSGGGIWWGWDGLTWYWNALVLGVLALGLKMPKYHDCWHQNSSCGCGRCNNGKCDTYNKGQGE